MNDEKDDIKQVSDAYHALDAKSPSQMLDKGILAQAKQQAELNKQAHQKYERDAQSQDSQSQKARQRKFSFQNLHLGYGGSIAASILLVSLIFVVFEQDVSVSNTDVARGITPHAVQSADSQQSPQLSTTADTLSLSSPPSVSESEQSIGIVSQAQEMSKRSRNVQAEVKADAQAMTNSESPDSLYSRLITLKTLALASKEKVEEGKNNDEFTDLQTRLFEALKKEKAADSNWRLVSKYEAVLTQQQIKELKGREHAE